MSQYNSQAQNMFLSQARKKHVKVEVILETGTVLRGKLRAYDQFSISLAFKDKIEIIYKSSIIYISILPQIRQFNNRFQSRSGSPRSTRYDAPNTAPLPTPRPFPDFDDDDFDTPPPKKSPPTRY